MAFKGPDKPGSVGLSAKEQSADALGTIAQSTEEHGTVAPGSVAPTIEKQSADALGTEEQGTVALGTETQSTETQGTVARSSEVPGAVSAAMATGMSPAISPARKPSACVAPLSGSTFRVTFTTSERFKHRLDRARELTSHAVVPSDLPKLLERALDLLIEREERRRYAVGPIARAVKHPNLTKQQPCQKSCPVPLSLQDPGRVTAVDGAATGTAEPGRSTTEDATFGAVNPQRAKAVDGTATRAADQGPVKTVNATTLAADPRRVTAANATTGAADPQRAKAVDGTATRAADPRPVTAADGTASAPKPISDATLRSDSKQQETLAAQGHSSTHRAQQWRSRYVPAAVRRAIWQRDKGRCTYVDALGNRCNERHLLEIEHRIPFARGGATSVQNCILMCRSHNTLAAHKSYGRSQIESAIATASARVKVTKRRAE